MAKLHFISQVLSKNILAQQTAYEDLGDITGIVLLKKQTSLPKNYVAIGDEQTVSTLLPSLTLKYPTTIFVAESHGRSDYALSYPDINFILTDLDLIDLYNKINIIVCNYNFWVSSLTRALCDGKNLQQLIGIAGDMINAPIFLLNAGLKVLCGTTKCYFDDIFVQDILQKGYLSYENNQKIFKHPISEHGVNYHVIEYQSNASGHCYFDCEINVNHTTIAHLFLVSTYTHTQIDIGNLTIHLAHIVKKFLLDSTTDLIGQTAVLSTFASDLFENRLTDSVEIGNRLKALPHPLKEFIFVITIRFDMERNQQKIPYGYIVSQLEEIFPDMNITVYNHDICIFYWQDQRSYGNLNFDHEALETLLTRYYAHAGISNGSRQLNKIRTFYLLSTSTITLGIPLMRDTGRRDYPHILYYEDYSMYYIIDLCVQKYIQLHGHDDIIYLAHPSIIALYRYDKEHNSDLHSVLFYYLINDSSVARTAKALFMHRNTIQNKLNKISEVITIPLDDGYVQQRMIFSCLIMRYYENYMKNQVKL